MLGRYVIVVLAILLLICSFASAQIATSKLTNRSGSAANVGAVVVVDTVNASSFVKTTTEADVGVVGVVFRSNIADDATGYVMINGIVDVTCIGAVAIGDYLITSTTGGSAKSNGTATAGSFGIALEAGTDTDISCFIYNGPATVNASGHIQLNDNKKVLLGTGSDAALYYDATNLIIDPREVGSGNVLTSADGANIGYVISAYHDTEATTPILTLRKADGTEAVPALVDDNAVLGTVSFQGYDGSGFHEGARIEARVDGTASDGTDMPGELTFWTVPDASATAVQRLTIDDAGQVGIGIAAPTYPFSVSDGTDQIGLTANGTDAELNWTDGALILQTDEAATHGVVQIKGQGASNRGQLRIYNNAETEYTFFEQSGSDAYLSIVGASPGAFQFQYGGDGNVYCFTGVAEGETPWLGIYGRRTGDTRRNLNMGISSTVNDTASFSGVSNYVFAGALQTTLDAAINGGDLTSSAATFALLNVTPTTLNIGGAATAVNVGAATGTFLVNNAITALNSATINSDEATVALFGTPTTVNAFGASTATAIGAATGTTTIGHDLTVTGDALVTSGTVVHGANSTTRGVVTTWDGAGTAAPGVWHTASTDGTEQWFFASNGGGLRVHTSLPTANTDGTPIGEKDQAYSSMSHIEGISNKWAVTATDDTWVPVDFNLTNAVIGHEDSSANAVASLVNSEITIGATGAGSYRTMVSFSGTGGVATNEDYWLGCAITFATPIDIASITNAEPPVVTTTAAHGFHHGATQGVVGVVIAGTTGAGSAAINISHLATVTGTTTFSLQDLSGVNRGAPGAIDASTGDVTIEVIGDSVTAVRFANANDIVPVASVGHVDLVSGDTVHAVVGAFSGSDDLGAMTTKLAITRD